ncbi:CD276 antigen isoform X2 [Denticeps clupeoides]|uniref:CD276 antigen isoform X2 n=1 Tax=Denticeps clupeoides TaxID=299321 RepID=UPI0010A3763C|nr:CD276 antigen-like isoform X2 [Denticeps clupeoides]
MTCWTWTPLLLLGCVAFSAERPAHKNGIVGEDVLLPCACTKEQNVTWQNKAENVVYDSRSNEEGRGYVNRTRLLLNNEGGRCSLLLRRVSVADEGTYVCYVLSTGERIVKKQETVLRVSAKYTVTVECRHGNSCTCNASGGYPEANVSWWQDGRRLENQSLMTSQRHEDSKLIDLFSTLTVHSNSKCVRCVVEAPFYSADGTYCDPVAPGSFNQESTVPTSVTAVILVLVLVVLLVLIYRWYRGRKIKMCPTRRPSDII